MKTSLREQFFKNLRHPKQAAVFRFLKVGNNILYCFFLTMIACILFSPPIFKQTIDTYFLFSFIFIPLMLILYYILLCCVAFFFVSILSGIALPIKTLLKRKLNYLQLWSISINAITWPTLLFAIINLLVKLPSYLIWVYVLACLGMVTYAILAVPMPKKKVIPSSATAKN
jgi:hypothetical protein